MSRSFADMPLHYGQVPAWLYTRMGLLGGAITEAIVTEYGRAAFLQRMSDPFWFQALGCVLGMDWHSSGITTSVMGALKGAINKRSQDLGLYICGGKGQHSKETPAELLKIAEKTGLDGGMLVRSSKLSAKVDNTGIQDGYQLYIHNFILSSNGDWAVIQQGMNDGNGMARRYHWHSPALRSFVEEPHSFIYGHNEGQIINVTDKGAASTRNGIIQIAREKPAAILPEIRNLLMPAHHDVKAKDVDLKRLGSVLAVAYEQEGLDMESLLLLEGLGPRTLQSLVLVSEVIHGTPSRFEDPARFSFAHGGKDGHPFPVPTKVYDETIQTLQTAVEKAKLGFNDKNAAIKNLGKAALRLEENFKPNDNFEQLIARERNESWKYGGRTVFGKALPPKQQATEQLKLF
ncbi:MAG: hypothetical protein BGO69_06285 [Bacteroidetes bacterium 46-16]|nr:MAG: hypothetical protein BGO69_06285 [Bacteroidetes bacterium 46-16]